MASADSPTRSLRVLVATIVLSVIGAFTVPTGHASAATTAVAPAAFDTSAYQRNVQTYVNAHRKANGLRPVALSAALSSACQGHVNDMARMNRMTHTGSNGSSGGSRISAAGFRWTTWGENVAVGYRTSNAVVYAWLNSPGHRANILNWRFTHMGVGITFAHGTVWWCQAFAA